MKEKQEQISDSLSKADSDCLCCPTHQACSPQRYIMTTCAVITENNWLEHRVKVWLSKRFSTSYLRFKIYTGVYRNGREKLWRMIE